MKRFLLIILCSLPLLSCAPVLRQELAVNSLYGFRLADLAEHPGAYEGRTLMFGGIIAKTTLTKEGSLIEALYMPVDSRGYHLDNAPAGRVLALFPGNKNILDPMIFREKREVTIAGEYIGMRKGVIDEIEYIYPIFRIVELYLWEEEKDYYRHPRHHLYMGYPYWSYGYEFWWAD
ncbi:MAG: Slp family lipoprotein [Nitrospirae bacterium]|nr:Slp family lipoprotein [Nitrospirota bacterium]